MKEKRIIVNATALDKGGALNILRQFLNNIPINDVKWLIFVSEKLSLDIAKENVEIIHISNVKSLVKRFLWDAFGINNWLKKHRIYPIAAISLQNTGFYIGRKVPSYIYYHQSLPFIAHKWNPFKRSERTFWFYKNIYPFFVSLFLRSNSFVFVQLNFIKNGFIKKFRHSSLHIGVFSPTVVSPNIKSNKIGYNKVLKLFYPATPHVYKNHKVIGDALCVTARNLEVVFTTEKLSNVRNDIRIKYTGELSYQDVCLMYNECDALVFPSYIETFGLPLLEAAMIGLPIIAADLPYAREVLEGYQGVKFVKYDDPKAWADSIDKLELNKRYPPLDISTRASWRELFTLIQNTIMKSEDGEI